MKDDNDLCFYALVALCVSLFLLLVVGLHALKGARADLRVERAKHAEEIGFYRKRIAADNQRLSDAIAADERTINKPNCLAIHAGDPTTVWAARIPAIRHDGNGSDDTAFPAQGGICYVAYDRERPEHITSVLLFDDR